MLQADGTQNVTDAGGIQPNADGAKPPPPANPRLVGEILCKQRRPSQLAEAARHLGNWLWQGYLGAGKITLLTAPSKWGKTTLMSNLVARMAAPGELLGLPVTPGRVAVITEEESKDWDERCRKLNMGEHASFFCDLFETKPTAEEWQALIDAMLALRARDGLDLVVIDPLVVFLPGNYENTASALMNYLIPLRRLRTAGMSVALVHHPRKAASLPGLAARGSGALTSYVDIVMELGWYGDTENVTERRRWLRGFSRYDETRRRLLIELDGAGNDYRVHDVEQGEVSADSAAVLLMVLEDAFEKLTQQQILADWPEDFPKPGVATISRALARGVEQGLIRREGSGRKGSPFRYWLAGREDDLYPGPNASPEALARFQHRYQLRMLKEIGVDTSRLEEPLGEANASPGSESEPPSATPEAPAAPALAESGAEKAAPAVSGAQSEPSEPPPHGLSEIEPASQPTECLSADVAALLEPPISEVKPVNPEPPQTAPLVAAPVNPPIAPEVPIVALAPTAVQPDSSRLSRPPAAPQPPARKKRKQRIKKQHVPSAARPEIKEQAALPASVPPPAPKPQPADPPEQSEEERLRIRLRMYPR
jgi:hypothetical protein